MKTIELLKQLLAEKKITKQAFRTYKGQVLSGDEAACIKGLKRKGLV